MRMCYRTAMVHNFKCKQFNENERQGILLDSMPTHESTIYSPIQRVYLWHWSLLLLPHSILHNYIVSFPYIELPCQLIDWFHGDTILSTNWFDIFIYELVLRFTFSIIRTFNFQLKIKTLIYFVFCFGEREEGIERVCVCVVWTQSKLIRMEEQTNVRNQVKINKCDPE